MTKPVTPTADAPIAEFSKCHEGILHRLEALDGLPELLDAAARARHVAADTVRFYREVVLEHHVEEERDLFPAVLASATAGDERAQVQAIAERLTREHRLVERAFAQLEPALQDAARGHAAALDPAAVSALVTQYEAHARYEEREFLPLAQRILSRQGDHMAALGVALHVRHAAPQVLAKYGARI